MENSRKFINVCNYQILIYDRFYLEYFNKKLISFIKTFDSLWMVKLKFHLSIVVQI